MSHNADNSPTFYNVIVRRLLQTPSVHIPAFGTHGGFYIMDGLELPKFERITFQFAPGRRETIVDSDGNYWPIDIWGQVSAAEIVERILVLRQERIMQTWTHNDNEALNGYLKEGGRE